MLEHHHSLFRSLEFLIDREARKEIFRDSQRGIHEESADVLEAFY